MLDCHGPFDGPTQKINEHPIFFWHPKRTLWNFIFSLHNFCIFHYIVYMRWILGFFLCFMCKFEKYIKWFKGKKMNLPLWMQIEHFIICCVTTNGELKKFCQQFLLKLCNVVPSNINFLFLLLSNSWLKTLHIGLHCAPQEVVHILFWNC